MLARQAINEITQGTVEVLVDSGTARDNVSRLGKKSGWSVMVEDQTEGSYRIVLQK
jgi:TusA-related sulfurtransferase